MSISYLLSPNDYNVYCKTITTDDIYLPGDSNEVELACSIYSKSGSVYTQQRSGITLKYKVHKNLLAMWMRSSTGDFTLIGNQTELFLGPYSAGTNTPLDWNLGYLIDSDDGDICNVVNFKSTTDNVAKMQFDTNKDNIPGMSVINLFPSSGAVWNNGNTMNLCNFFIVAPVSKV